MQQTLRDDLELAALRKLEQAVRACGLPNMMVSGQTQLERLASVLNEVAEARKAVAG